MILNDHSEELRNFSFDSYDDKSVHKSLKLFRFAACEATVGTDLSNETWRMSQSVTGVVSEMKYECGKCPSVFKQAWPAKRVRLLKVKHLGSLSQRARGLKPCTPPTVIIPPPHCDQHQMPTIPGRHSQSMLGGTKADLQPIGSTLLTACNLLMSLAGALASRGRRE